ncbi:MAG: hypothetical protein U0401_11130 [Anaerolineae bacterium]
MTEGRDIEEDGAGAHFGLHRRYGFYKTMQAELNVPVIDAV